MQVIVDTDSATLLQGDALAVLAQLAPNSADALVTDPPAGIGFMGKEWDSDKGGREQWIAWLASVMREALRVLKPGAHALVWAIPRTSHWTMNALDDAGFEIRDVVSHLFGTGFPKSLNVAKAIDATERFGGSGSQQLRAREGLTVGSVGTNMSTHRSGRNDVREVPRCKCGHPGNRHDPDCDVDGCGCLRWSSAGETLTDNASVWNGWGTALKPGGEFWILARKPLLGTVAANVLEHGTGALNVDGCRLAPTGERYNRSQASSGYSGIDGYTVGTGRNVDEKGAGRWPANVVLSEEAAADLDAETMEYPSKKAIREALMRGEPVPQPHGASRFYFSAKTSKAERDYGCELLPVKSGHDMTEREEGSAGLQNPRAGAGRSGGARNHHPTVKPQSLMRWLVRLITPPGGVVLDPFAGSGSTGVAALAEHARFIGIELSEEYLPITKARIERALLDLEGTVQ